MAKEDALVQGTQLGDQYIETNQLMYSQQPIQVVYNQGQVIQLSGDLALNTLGTVYKTGQLLALNTAGNLVNYSAAAVAPQNRPIAVLVTNNMASANTKGADGNFYSVVPLCGQVVLSSSAIIAGNLAADVTAFTALTNVIVAPVAAFMYSEPVYIIQ